MLTLTSPELPSLRLRQATQADQENLRTWKNALREFFFFKDEITPEMQANWFAKHQTRTWDMMLVVEESADGGETFYPTGCMGYRLQEDGKIDLYNILRGTRLAGTPHTMGDAFNLMNIFLHQTYRLPLGCEVLENNPARKWYEKLGMEATGHGEKPDPHVLYTLNPSKLPTFQVKVHLA